MDGAIDVMANSQKGANMNDINTEIKNKFWYWGYPHDNGKPQLKRWFGDHIDYTGDYIGNPFMLRCCLLEIEKVPKETKGG